MKTFARLLMTIAALVAVSCATDTTEDLGIQLGNEVQTTLSISLEGTKTHIGEKAGDEYPLYWSAGDKIAVNGVASEALTEEAHGKSVANFVMNGELVHPYNVVYPAPAEGVVATEGKQAVTFLASQEYKAGTFAEGSAPMYGYVAAEGDAIALNHLSGVLCLAPMGEATLTSMTIVSESGKIAGNFDVDCADGTLVAHEDATNTVTVSFGEGLVLGAEATPIYVAVPAGEYGIFTVTLNTATDSMVVKFNSAGEKAIKAGVVRKFNEFAYAADGDVPEIFEIYDEASLRRFAELASSFAPRKGAKVTATIDMTGKEWTAIEGFGAYTFDGGKAEGFQIKGLSAPLFDTTSATITNVDLVDVNITETERTSSGSLVCVLTKGGSVSNCSVSGNYTYNKTTGKMTGEIWGEYCAGALVGRVIDATVNDSSSSANFSVVSVCQTLAAKSYPSFGGVVGAIDNSADYVTGEDSTVTAGETLTYNNLTNNGVVSYDGVHGALKVQPAIGGVVGYATHSNLTNMTNNAEVKFNKAAFCSYFGGVVGSIFETSCENLTNNADVTVDAQVQWAYMGGVIAQINSSTIARTAKNLTNNGKFITTANSDLTSMGAIGGVIGVVSKNNLVTLTNSHNRGELDIDCSAAIKECRIGGLIGSSILLLAENCQNHAAVKVKISTNATQVGGLVGLQQSSSSGTVKSCENHGAVEVTGQAHTASVMVGGVVGYNKAGTYKNNTNCAAVTFSGTAAGRAYISGGVGASEYLVSGIVNEGAVTITEGAKLVGLCLGGAVGYCKKNITDCTNRGPVSYYGNTDMDNAWEIVTNKETNEDEVVYTKGCEVFCVGGVLGWSAKTGNARLTNEKTGTVVVGGRFTASLSKRYGYTSLGGVAGRLSSGTHNAIHNYADVTFSSNIPNASWNEEPFPLGGTLGYVTGSLTNISNSGTITFSGTCKSDEQIRFSGVVGRGSNEAAHVYTNIINYGKVVVSGTSSDQIWVSGINSYNTKSIYNNVVNHGDIEVTETAKSGAELFVAGVFGYPGATMTASGLVCNTGDITVKGTGTSVYIGGCATAHNNEGMNTYVNIGNIYAECKASAADGKIYVGGIVAVAKTNIHNAKCHCNISALSSQAVKGWITASDRTPGDETVLPVKAIQCEIGGNELGEIDPESEAPEERPITSSNFHNFIFGSGSNTDWTGAVNYDGCLFLSKKPTVE
jgi:hypothetical protein